MWKNKGLSAMDEKKDEQDLTVGLDGAMTEGVTSAQPPQPEEPVAAQSPPETPEVTEPSINTMDPPPNDETVKLPEPQKEPEFNPSSGVVKAPDDTSSMNTLASPGPQAFQPDDDAEPVAASANNRTEPEEYSQTSRNTIKRSPPHEHRNNKKLAVFMTVFVALLLSSAAVFVYISAQDNATPEQPVIPPVVAPTEIQPALDEVNDNDPTLIDETIEQPVNEPQTNNDLQSEEEPVPEPVAR